MTTVGLVRDLSVPVVRFKYRKNVDMIETRHKEEQQNMLSDDCEHIPWFSKVTNLVDSLQSHCDELLDGSQISRHTLIAAKEPDRADATSKIVKERGFRSRWVPHSEKPE
jgi:hypothetical protein